MSTHPEERPVVCWPLALRWPIGLRAAGQHSYRVAAYVYWRRRWLSCRLWQQQDAQSLVLVALILPVLALFLIGSIEIGNRLYQVATLQDALQASTRTAVQTFEYAEFAHDDFGLAAEERVAKLARETLITNLRGQSGLAETPEQTADRVQFTVLPAGGSCTFPGQPVQVFSAPALCAVLQPRMRPLIPLALTGGRDPWIPTISAADTLDRIGD